MNLNAIDTRERYIWVLVSSRRFTEKLRIPSKSSESNVFLMLANLYWVHFPKHLINPISWLLHDLLPFSKHTLSFIPNNSKSIFEKIYLHKILRKKSN
ncbi:hypothetical protein NH340_JMT07838 [Sarcoptes scabiei]|nr:Glucose transporter type 1 [Sarcoptes scabiei]UXI21895.1 hypothetical protein NH340_JMT07838 [Sarcoptes scabiei]